MTQGITVWYLIKTIGCGNRADSNRFEQNIIAGLRHGEPSINALYSTPSTIVCTLVDADIRSFFASAYRSEWYQSCACW